MLSQLLQSARNILPVRKRAPKEDPSTDIVILTPSMVTTRRQSRKQNALSTESSPVVGDGSSGGASVGSKKRRRTELSNESSPPEEHDDSSSSLTKKKRKGLPTRNKDEEHFESHSHFEIEIPVRDIVENITNDTNVSGQGKPKRKRALVDDDQVSNSESGRKTQTSKNNKINTSSLPHQTGDGDSSANTNTIQVPVSKHKRFGSEEPQVEEVELLAKNEAEPSEDEDESDDDAPEVVDTHEAQEKALNVARNASKAVEEQNAVVRKKRKERDLRLKEQAKSSNKRSKTVDDGGNVLPKPTTTDAATEYENFLATGLSEEKLDVSYMGENPETQKVAEEEAIPESKVRISKSNLPEYLPLEYLEDDPIDVASDLQHTMQNSRKSKKTKFIDPVPKRPKDRTKGSVTYRVSEAEGDGLLAPKAVNSARSVKEAWLKGRNGGSKGGAGGLNRKIPNASFLKKRR